MILSYLDNLNPDNLSISSLNSEDIEIIIPNNAERRIKNDNKEVIKEMIKEVYKEGVIEIPTKETDTAFEIKIGYISDKKKGKIMANEQLIEELGLTPADMGKFGGKEGYNMLTDDKKIEEFIVLRAIKDSNMPKFHETDTIIFESITQDIFQTSINSNTKQTTLKNIIESVLIDNGCQVSDEIVSRIMYLHQQIQARHGIMVVGSTMSGKTTTINSLEESLKRSLENEIQEKTLIYKYQKAKMTGRKHNKKLKNVKPGHDDVNAVDDIKLTLDDQKIIRAKCKNNPLSTYHINPKSITIGQLMGNFDETSHDWNDGILAYLMRE